MKKTFLFSLLGGMLMLACRPAVTLDPEGWDPKVYAALTDVLSDPSNRGGYAVFDCDNTSIRHDVTHTLTIYLVENLAFADAAEHGFLDGLPDPDRELARFGMTAREAGAELQAEWRQLKQLQEGGMSLDEIHGTPLYLDFRARFMAFYGALGDVYDYGELCLWEPALLSRPDSAEAVSVARSSIRYWLAEGREWEETWTSPDGRFTGTVQKGLIVPRYMKNLYKALQEADITTYVISASAEWLVELLVCDPDLGFGLDPSRVYGVRVAPGASALKDDDPQPYKEGKVFCIREKIAPLYGGREPVLAAGDSNGDVAMLTAWPDLKMGLVVDCGRSGAIDSLARCGGKYYRQPGPLPGSGEEVCLP